MRRVWHPRTGTTVFLTHLSTTTELVIINLIPQHDPQPDPQFASDAVILDHEGGKGLLKHRNKIAVFNRDGDVIFSDSTRELGNSVKDACAAITKDQASKKKQ